MIRMMDVETQEQLLAELKLRGFTTTQATISRDIKQLRLVKELTPSGSYRYVAADRQEGKSSAGRLRNIFKEGVVSVEAAQNLVVVKTMPGLASAACSALDGMEIAGMVGSLAGDDTGDAHHAGQRLGRGILQRSPQAAGVSLRQVRRGKDAFSASH